MYNNETEFGREEGKKKEAWYIAKKLDNPEKSYGASSRDTGTYSIGENEWTGWLNESD